MIRVRKAMVADAAELEVFRCELWPEDSAEEHAAELENYFDSRGLPNTEVLVAEEDGSLLGFAEVSIRPFAEGCTSQNVGYLEGWYVVDGARRRGVGRRLIEATEEWAREKGCTEFASDAMADNEESHAAHLATGFEDVGLIRCFRKDL